MNLYGFVGNDGVNQLDLLGLWTTIKREWGRWADTCAEVGYTWDDLAAKVGLDVSEVDEWVANFEMMDSLGPTAGKVYLVPKVVVFYTAKVVDFIPTGKKTQDDLKLAAQVLQFQHRRAGFHLLTRYDQSSVALFEAGWAEEGIYRYVFTGHGAEVGGKGVWEYLADPNGGTASVGPFNPLPYKLNKVWALHCGGAYIPNFQKNAMEVIGGLSPAFFDWDYKFECIKGGVRSPTLPPSREMP